MQQVSLCFLILLCTSWLLPSCTSEKKPPPLTEEEYSKSTQMMLDITGKFLNETDIKRLHSAAVATQQARVVSCSNFNDECSIYGKFVSLVIDSSKDSVISSAEKRTLFEKREALKEAIKAGKEKLRSDWKIYKNQTK